MFVIDDVSDEDDSGSPAQADSQGIPLEAVVSTQENQHESGTVKRTLDEACSEIQEFKDWLKLRRMARDQLRSDGPSGDLHGEPIDDVSDEDERGSPREHSGTKCT